MTDIMHEELTFMQSVQHIEGLVQRLESIADPAVRATMQQLVQSLMTLHGAALKRLLTFIAHAGEPGQAILGHCVQDDVVASVLLLYDLHPVNLETRVRQALDKVRPSLHAHGSDVELVSLEDGVVRVRLPGNGRGYASSTMAFKLAIEAALYEAAPDMVRLEVEGTVDSAAPADFIPLTQFRGISHTGAPEWRPRGPDSLLQSP